MTVTQNCIGTVATHVNLPPGGATCGYVTTGYMQTICCECKEPIQLVGWTKINEMAACEYCYRLHQISHNPVKKCPYKDPRSRKLPKKPEPIKYELSRGISYNNNDDIFMQPIKR